MQEITREYGFFESLPKIEAKLDNLFLIALMQKLEIVFLLVTNFWALGFRFGFLETQKVLLMQTTHAQPKKL